MDEYASGESAVYFMYDADNRRIWAKRNGTEEKYVLSDQDVIADYDGEDTVTATYNTPGLDSNLTKKIGENVYFYVRDGLGSIRKILDSDETAQNAYDYLAFGSVYGSPTENVTNRYRFTAREWESIPTLHYYRARMMDQTLGRFLSKDKMSRTENPYWYSNNNPVVFLDPLGLYTVMFKGIEYLPVKPYTPIYSTSLKWAAAILEFVHNEPAFVYRHEDIGVAMKAIREYFKDEKRKKCEKLNVVGYSCGSDSALSVVRFVAASSILRDIEITSLIYLDFNFGAAKWPPCKHAKIGGTSNYSIPSTVKNKLHMTSGGTMKKGKRKKFPNILWHTLELWDRCPGPYWCKQLEDDLGWEAFWNEGKLNPEAAIEHAAWGLTNTSGACTVVQNLEGWPAHMELVPYDEGDHIQMGEDPNVGKWIANKIISLKNEG